MPDRGIIFSAPMVRALIEGRKTQTRRVLGKTGGDVNIFSPSVGWSDSYVLDDGNAEWRARYTPYAPGDRLWVREAWQQDPSREAPHYCADDEGPVEQTGIIFPSKSSLPFPKRSPIFMPRRISRLTLTVTDVRVERVQDISDEDARAEGVSAWSMGGEGCGANYTARDAYHALWDTLHGAGAWDANPWVVAITFTVRKGNIDA